MIIEDDQASRTAMRYLLGHRGWRAAEAATLSAGKTLLRQDLPDVVLLDLMLPDGDGVELLRAIRDEKLNVRVAVITGVGDTEALQAVRQLNPDAFFRKPVDVAALLNWLDS